MGQKPQILVDTDVIVKVFRGEVVFRDALDNFKGIISLSVITYIELLYGVRTTSRIIQLNKQMRAYKILLVSEAISELSLKITKTYTSTTNIGLGDVLIAATAIHYKLPLFTNNKKDYDFIKGLKLYEI